MLAYACLSSNTHCRHIERLGYVPGIGRIKGRTERMIMHNISVSLLACRVAGVKIVGNWLDNRYGTQFLGLLGFAMGVALGIWHLVVMTSPPKGGADKSKVEKK